MCCICVLNIIINGLFQDRTGHPQLQTSIKHLYIHIYLHLSLYMYVHIYVYIHIYIYMYIYTCIYIYICIYIFSDNMINHHISAYTNL